MFANFELSSGGLVAADVKPKRTRTDLGCLPCRRKKKKCDLSKPICLRCRKSIGAVVCEWPAHAASLSPEEGGRLSRSHSQPCQQDEESSISSPSKPDSPSETTLVRRHKATNRNCSTYQSSTTEHAWKTPSPQGSIENTITLSLPAGVNKVAPRLSPSQLIQITTAFDKAIISQDDRSYDRPASHLYLPLCLQNSGLMHAWLSCGTAFLASRRPGGIQRSLLHYQHAVRELANALSGTGLASPEWKLATVLLLHTFESMSPRTDEDANMRIAHLNGAHNLVRASMMNRPPTSMHELLLLEAYVYRTATNRLFQPFSTLPYDHIERLYGAMCASGSPRQDMIVSWRKCPWVGMSAPLFDIIFKLSWLRDHMPLQGNDLIEAISLSQKIANWRPPVEAPEDLFDIDAGTADLFMMKNLLAAKAYWYASLLFSHKLLNPANGPFDPEILAISRQGYKVLQQVLMMQSGTALILWTIAVLGMGAVTPEQQAEFVNVVQACAVRSGPGSIQRTMQFLQWAWAPDATSEAGFLGADILLRTDILRQLFL